MILKEYFNNYNMKTIEEILSLPTEQEKIALLRKRATPLPDALSLLKDWEPEKHDIMDKTKRKDGKSLVKAGYKDEKTGKIYPPVYEDEPVNRICLPLEQDIVNIHTAFTVGKEPLLTCETEDKKEKDLFEVIKSINKENKIRFHNKKVVRSWLSETEVAEYWYVSEDLGFWAKIIRKLGIKIGVNVKYKLRCAIWSPFRGDKLYPIFNDNGDYIALSREYQVKDNEGNIVNYFMTVTDKEVYKWKLNTNEKPEVFRHGFKKNPTIYAYREKPYCYKIKTIRERLEELKSDFADCIKQNFFPKLILQGDIKNETPQKIGKSKMIKIEGEGKAYYLDWTQTPEMVKTEFEGLYNDAYSLTNTPRISFENLRGTGNALSGKAFEYVFLGTHLAVDNHAEEIGLFLQRRYNFLVSAVGSINTEFEEASNSIEIDVDIVPFTLKDMKENIEMASLALGGNPIASTKTGVLLAGIVDKVDEEVKLIEEENNVKIAPSK